MSETDPQAITAALTWRCWVKNATHYFVFFSQTEQQVQMSEGPYKLAPGTLHDWARERMLGCLRSAWRLWPIFKDDSHAVRLAHAAAHHWQESLSLVALICSAQELTKDSVPEGYEKKVIAAEG